MESLVYYRSAQAIAIPTLSLLAIILSVPPLVWHSVNRNFPASCLVGWFLIANLFNVMNALIWPTDDVDSWWSGAGLCDIEVRVWLASYVGLPGALLCIFRSLAEVMDTDRTTLVPSRAQRRRNLAIEGTFCLGLPAVASIVQFVVQPNRYIISTISGCQTTYDTSWPSIVLSYMWPPIVCLLAGCYCGTLESYLLNARW
jgi:pheromone a factor receptor